MARFTVVGGPSTLEQHKKMLQEYRIRQAYIDGAKTSSSRSGRPAMNSNFMTFAPTNSTSGSRLYTENILRNHPAWVRDEVGKAMIEGAMSGGRLYGSDLGWAAAEYADKRLTERRMAKKKEDDSVRNSAPIISGATPGQPTSKPDSSAATTTPTATGSSTTTDATTPASGSSKTGSKAKTESKKDVTDTAKVDAPPPLSPKPTEQAATYSRHKVGFDKFASSELGEKQGTLAARDLIIASGVSADQATNLMYVLSNWDDDSFVDYVSADALSKAVSALKAGTSSGKLYTAREIKLRDAIVDRIEKAMARKANADAGNRVAEALN